MTTESNDNTQTAPAAPAAEGQPAPLSFAIAAQYIRDLSFEGPAHPADVQTQSAPQIDVNVTANTRNLNGNMFEVALNIRAAAKLAEKHAFLVELSYAGLVNVPPGLNEDALRFILLVEVPRHLFPFARNIVANATRDGGFPPLLLQPIDFVALFRQQMAQEAAAPPAGHA